MLLLVLVFMIAAVTLMAVSLDVLSMPDNTVRGRVKKLERPKVKKNSNSALTSAASTGFLHRFTPESMLAKIDRNLILAGRPASWSRDKAIVLKPIGAAAGSFFAFVFITNGGGLMMTLMGLGLIVLGYFVPDLLIYNMAIKRQEQIQKELPDALDQIVIGIEAGTGFEAALRRLAERNSGPFADEVSRLLQDVELGRSRREAYLALADRTTVEELKAFCKSIVQAEEFGVSVASVVRTQATEMRRGRRLRAEAKAQQVPVKILIPLMLLILPVLFIIVMGPPVVNAFAIN